MRERPPRCTYSFSLSPNIPIFSLPYSHILTLHSADYVDLVLKLAAFGSAPNDTEERYSRGGLVLIRRFVGSDVRLQVGCSVAQGQLCADSNLKKSLGYL